ncbi:hypothetical protein CGLO_13418 [Colletotrichum gloeosporioides Cg-14]|uniref:Uncharacterized protein n=1 Tax=Colletotrichum gloeosporioides (strain Cg-14) TaxID=1237896 RepID=T0LGY6_COLGC|nr:hypothetical protein CGLO_13418 [Colletotrichum gloeosporioides Cg-14]
MDELQKVKMLSMSRKALMNSLV